MPLPDPTTTTPAAPADHDDHDDPPDHALAERAVGGDREALEALLARHLPFVYNLAFRMVMTRQDAEDVTQEIAIKVLTKLATFDPGAASFRTWLYRVVVNHVINMKARGYERSVPPLERYYGFVAAVPDEAPGDSPEALQIAADLAIGCLTGVLLCVGREPRVAFLLAVAFGASDAEGAEIMGVTREAFRKMVSRAREQVRGAVEAHCGLANPAAPCRCANKVPGLVRLGAYGGGKRLEFVDEAAPRLREIVGDKIERFGREIYPEYARLVREQPFYRGPDLRVWLRQLVDRPDFKEIFDAG